MGIRTTAAILSARMLSFACKIAGKQGVTMAGKLAMKMDPQILRKLASQVRGEIIVTCGTNGKTTTNNLICSALEAEGKKVLVMVGAAHFYDKNGLVNLMRQRGYTVTRISPAARNDTQVIGAD